MGTKERILSAYLLLRCMTGIDYSSSPELVLYSLEEGSGLGGRRGVATSGSFPIQRQKRRSVRQSHGQKVIRFCDPIAVKEMISAPSETERSKGLTSSRVKGICIAKRLRAFVNDPDNARGFDGSEVLDRVTVVEVDYEGSHFCLPPNSCHMGVVDVAVSTP